MPTCETGKVAFVSEKAARHELRHIQAHDRNKGVQRAPHRVYRCDKCSWWHLTHQDFIGLRPPKKFRRRPRRRDDEDVEFS